MTAQVPRLPFSLHALVAEARRRARRRRTLLAVVVIALAGGAGGAVYATHPFGWFRSSATARRFLYRPYSTADLSSVSAASRKTAWIVGSVAWRWNGTAWRSVPLPPVAGNVTLSSVAAVAPDDVWAVGGQVRCHYVSHTPHLLTPECLTTPLIEHWDGMRWSAALIGGSRDLMRSVSAAGPRNVWVLGQTYPTGRVARPLLLHWNGHAWLRQPVPAASIEGVDDQVKVVAAGYSGVWLVPTGLGRNIEYWNGTRWQAVPRPFGPRDLIADFSATGGNDAWAVGSQGLLGAGNWRARLSHPLAAHWNGSAWAVTPVPEMPWRNDARLDSVVAVRRNDVWALGRSQHVDTIRRAGLRALVVHWNGSRWSVASGSGLGHMYPYGIAAAADGSAWAIGSCGRDTVVLGWNGATWHVVPHPPDIQWPRSVPPSDRRGWLTSCGSAASGG